MVVDLPQPEGPTRATLSRQLERKALEKSSQFPGRTVDVEVTQNAHTRSAGVTEVDALELDVPTDSCPVELDTIRRFGIDFGLVVDKPQQRSTGR